MIKTAQELAAMKLLGFPATEFGVRKKAAAEGWETAGKVGKAILYRVPARFQAQIIERSGLTIKIDEPTEDKRLTARLYIVQAFKAYCRDHGLKLMQGELGFIALYDEQKRSGAVEPFPQWIFDVYPTFSAASLRNWRTKASANPSALKDSYGNRKGQSILARANGGRVAEAIEAIICTRQLMGAYTIRKLIRIDFGDQLEVDGRMVDLPQIRAFERHIAAWKQDNPELYEKATNPDGWRNKYMLSIGDASAEITRLNQRWEIDASPMDVLCKDGRYVIYALIDVWSRRLMLHVSPTATTESSLQLIRRACLEWGMPESIKTDNGSDFVSKRFKTALLQLGIEQVISGPFQPWKKSFVERVIGSFQHGFAPTMPGFIGHSVADRKKIEGAKSFADNLGADKSARYSVELTHDELQAHINNWVDGEYHQRPHSGIGMTPFAKVATSADRIRLIDDVRTLDVLLSPIAGTRKVTKEALRVDGATFWNDTLSLYMGKEVFVRLNPEDMGRIYVFDMDNTFICEALNWDRMGVNRAEATSKSKAEQKRHINEALAKARKVAKKEYSLGATAEKLSTFNANAAAKVKAFPKQSENYTTPSLDEAARAVTKQHIPLQRTAEQEARQEAFIEDFKTFQQERERKKTDLERWKERATDIEQRRAAGEPISEGDATWHAEMVGEFWYQAWKDAEAHKAALEGV